MKDWRQFVDCTRKSQYKSNNKEINFRRVMLLKPPTIEIRLIKPNTRRENITNNYGYLWFPLPSPLHDMKVDPAMVNYYYP